MAIEPQDVKIRPVLIVYDCVEWTTRDTPVRCSVPTSSIVALVPRTDEHELLIYVVTQSAKPGKVPVPTKLVSVQLGERLGSEFDRFRIKDGPAHLGLAPEDGEVTGIPPSSSKDAPTGYRPRKRYIHVIVSTLSGTCAAEPFFANVLKPLLHEVGVKDYSVYETESEATIYDLAKTVFVPRALGGFLQTIILLSGDGGLIDLVRAFSDIPGAEVFAKPTICLLPLGTGNATANSAGILMDSTLGLSALMRGTPKDLPTFQIRLSAGSTYVTDEGQGRAPIFHDHYGMVVFSWGFHASLVADSDTAEYRKFGPERFKMAANELLYPPSGEPTHSYKGSIALIRRDKETGEVRETYVTATQHMYVLATMASNLEHGFTISPHSKPLDGQLRLVYFPHVAPERAMELMGLAYQGGKHVEQEDVLYEPLEGVRIEMVEQDERWRRICVDGKIIAIAENGTAEVRRTDKIFFQLAVL